MSLREISFNLVDRVLRIQCHMIHEITLSQTKEPRYKSFCAKPAMDNDRESHETTPDHFLSYGSVIWGGVHETPGRIGG